MTEIINKLEEVDKLTWEQLIEQINLFSELKKQRDLNEQEILIRDALRKRYIETYKKNLLNQIASIKVVDENGNDISSDKLKELKKGDKNEK